MDFLSGKELLSLCNEHGLSISEVMLSREMELGNVSREDVMDKLMYAFDIMNSSSHIPIDTPMESIGGLIGGEAKAVTDYHKQNPMRSLFGDTLNKAIAYSLAVLEVNATMGLIVAAPTAGSSGVVPAALMSVYEEFDLSKESVLNGLLNTSAVGYIVMRNASVSGAEAGCQAEVGAASAMAASALVELMGGTPEMSLHAASIALSNLLGLVCDPIAGLVEAPCQSRNAIGVTNAFACAQMALSGIKHPIPFDEMVAAMYRVGCDLPVELRETALGGNASTPTGCQLHCNIYG